MHVDWIEASRVLSIVDVLTKAREPISFLCMSAITLSVDEIMCVFLEVVVISRKTSVKAFILKPRPGLAMRVVVSVWLLVLLLFSRSSTVVGNRRSWILSSNLMQGVSGQALNFTVLRGV